MLLKQLDGDGKEIPATSPLPVKLVQRGTTAAPTPK
jgi:hypothetical protein